MAFSLEDLMSRSVEPWMPHKEESHPRFLTGVVIKVTTTVSDYSGEPVPVVEVVPPDDPGRIWRITGYHGVLARELSEQRPEQGDTIGVRYEGQVEGKERSYEKYRVVVQRPEKPEPPIDWDSIEAAAREEIGEEEEPFE